MVLYIYPNAAWQRTNSRMKKGKLIRMIKSRRMRWARYGGEEEFI
jgi:hypothetical protein